MNQFKPLFLGTADPSLALSKLTRACNSQKCIRAGGKHNDLDDVGKDVYHHTFFEMLGNWSFGDYFKEEAIKWAWECLTGVFGLDPERIYATYFGGDKAQGIPADDESKAIWLKYLPDERVLPFSSKDNFWEMGDTGPCGPCTEIHYDKIGGRDAAKLVNADVSDVIEIWNVVFIQFNRAENGVLKDLPNKHVDTGMGFERLAAILQGKMSNYDTDVFMPLFAAIQAATGAPPYTGLVGADDKDNRDMAYRVVADHIRTLTFAITDGALPSNIGRGYVLRRILRRGVRFGQQILNAKPGFFSELVPVAVRMLGEAFPELKVRKDFVQEVIKDEEMSFNRTLEKGLKEFKKIASAGGKVFPGDIAFFLYGTMGFPVDLTQLMAEEQGMTVDMEGFQLAMDKEQAISAAAMAQRKASGGKVLALGADQTSHLMSNNVETTDASNKYTWHHEPTAKVLGLYVGADENLGFVEEAKAGEVVGVILDSTSFYAEQGGQVNDTGLIASADGTFSMAVDNVQAYAGYALHTGTIEVGSIAKGATVTCMVDYERRSLIAPNHTMTHVLNFALRKVLIGAVGDGMSADGMCDQKGSYVDDVKLRFDFAWNGGLTFEQTKEVEDTVNDIIKKEMPVEAYVAPLEQASKISALRCVFGERYPDPVRVLSVGQDVPSMLQDPTNPDWSGYSVEFCGGTHLTNTRQAVSFALLEEAGIAKGVRRIVAVTKDKALEAEDTAAAFDAELHAAKSLEPAELAQAIKLLQPKLANLTISAVKKAQFKDVISKLFEVVKAHKKELDKQAKAMKATILADAVSEAEAAKASGKTRVALHRDFGMDPKHGSKCLEGMKKVYAEAELLAIVSGDSAAGRFQVYATCPAGNTQAWVIKHPPFSLLSSNLSPSSFLISVSTPR
ncbi:unnamed protein product [Chrysoparadoxa australica]